jgi:hypothetical protein
MQEEIAARFHHRSGMLFVVFVFLISGSLGMLAFMIPGVVLISWLNLRMIRICSACGRTIHSGMGSQERNTALSVVLA